jgi:hypothetical protein
MPLLIMDVIKMNERKIIEYTIVSKSFYDEPMVKYAPGIRVELSPN